ncbi:MAG: polysaccharide biosynthesis C-terminal domain-containing protein [Clostridia bacterium]|nr:polysaccharide biosynthesis C-terminal domain-containing protein [Clostridia bacterium]
MIRIKNVDIVHGNVMKSIIRYCIPVILIGLVQSLFNAVDLMVLGAMADTNAVASVGATTSLIHLLVNTFFGFSGGAKIVLARLLGAGEDDKVRRTVSTAMLLAAVLGCATAVGGFFLAPVFLRVTGCPEACFDGAMLYMRLYLAAAPAIMLYNFGSAVLSASGDSQRPLYYMLLSGGMNVVLNVLLCLVMPQKVAAVAIATAVSQIVGAVLVFLRLLRMEGACRLSLRKLRWSKFAFRKLMVNGVPLALHTALYPLANLQIQAQINSFGAAVMAGNSAAISIEGMIGPVASSAWASTTTVFVGQNIGANKPDRVKKSILYPLFISASLGLLLGGLAMVFSRPLLSMYVSEEAAILGGQIRMRYVALPYAISCINGILSHVIQAFGYSAFCTVNSVVSVLLFRVFWMNVIYPLDPTFDTLCQCYLVSWLLILVVNVVFTLYLYKKKFKKGKLKQFA